MPKKSKGKKQEKERVISTEIEIKLGELITRFMECLDDEELKETFRKFFVLRAKQDDMHAMMKVVVISDIHKMLTQVKEEAEEEKSKEETEH